MRLPGRVAELRIMFVARLAAHEPGILNIRCFLTDLPVYYGLLGGPSSTGDSHCQPVLQIVNSVPCPVST